MSVEWARMEQAVQELEEYYCNWRSKVAAGQGVGTSTSINRRVVVEVTEGVQSRAAFNFTEFPYTRPRNGELPGFLAMRSTVELQALRALHQAIYREFIFMNTYGYCAEMAGIASEMGLELGKAGIADLPAGSTVTELATVAETKDIREDLMAVMMGLSRVLQRVSCDYVRMRGDFVRMIGTDRLAVAS